MPAEVRARRDAWTGDGGKIVFPRVILSLDPNWSSPDGKRPSLQGLGFALGRPVLPVDSLLIVAEDARLQAGAGDGFELWVAMDARMGEVYAGAYRWAAGLWQSPSAPALYTLDALHRAWELAPPAAVA